MIELRPRKVAKLQVAVSGADAPQEGNGAAPAAEACPQVKKRSRKPKSTAPVQCKKESKETPLVCKGGPQPVTSQSQDDGQQCGPVKKRGRTPKLVRDRGCAQASCVTEAPCPKRRRKQKASEESKCEIPKSGQGTAVPKETDHGRTTPVRPPDEGVGPQTVSTQNSGQVNKRGRKLKIQPRVKCEELDTGHVSHGKCADPDCGSKEQDQVSVCSGRGQPRRKSGSGKGAKSQGSPEEAKGFSCAGKSKVRVRLQRSLLSQVSGKADVPPGDLRCGEKKPPEPLHGEERTTRTELARPETKPSTSRRIKRIRPISIEEKPKILVSTEQNASGLTPASEKDEGKVVKSTMSESNVVKCSSNTCHVHSPGLQNPVVTLQNCKNVPLHPFNKRAVGHGSMFTRKMQSQTSHIDSVASEGNSISALETIKHNEKVVNSASRVIIKRPPKTILKVKFNFRKRRQKNNPSEESDIELKSVNQQNSGDCISKLKASEVHNETLMDKLNNNTITSARLDYTGEESKHGTFPICSLGGNWRSQALLKSDEEISDHDFDKSTVTVSSTNISEAKEGLAVTCQRVIPFTGKTIRKWSCARTYVSVIPRKRLADVQNTTNVGTEADRPQENHSDECNNGESIQERAQDKEIEATCKKRRLDLRVESTSPSKCDSSKSTLDKSLSNENNSVREELLTTSDTSHFLPLASVPSIKTLNRKCLKLLAEVKAPGVGQKSQQGPREDKTCLPSKPPLEMKIDCKTVINPVPFNVPNEESRALLHIGVPIECSIKKELQNEVCSVSTALEEVSTTVLKDDMKSSPDHSDSEDVPSNCCPSEGFTKSDSGRPEEACASAVTLAPASTKKSTNNNTLDLLKAYEEDVLVLDVNEDDPELFDFCIKEERSSKQYCHTNSVTWSKGNKMSPISKVQKKRVSSAFERKTPPKRIEYVPESITNVTNDFCDATSDLEDTCDSLPETNEMPSFAEVEESREPKESQDKDSPIELHHTTMLDESSSLFQEVLPSKSLYQPQQPLFQHPISESGINNSSLCMHDIHSSLKDTVPTETASTDSREKWKQEKAVPRIKHYFLPYGYCRYFFNTFTGCLRNYCKYLHIPRRWEEKVCMDLLRKMINENNIFFLKRAVWIFRNYYSLYRPGLNYDRGIFGALLNPLVNQSLWQDVFDLLETAAAAAKIFPSSEQIIKVFESAAFSGPQNALLPLLDVFCKFVHNGMSIAPMDINHIIAIMSKSNAGKNQIHILLSIKSSLELKNSKTNWAYDMDAALSEVEHCKVNSDWMKLGTLYLTVCTGCEDVTNLKTFSGCIAEALKKDVINQKPEIPYCFFADFIFKNPQFNDIQKNILGRIGISVLFFYHGKEQWMKGRKVIHKFHELKINYTVLKGISGQESSASRCHVVNVAVEIFLKCGSLGSAVQTLKECDWIINTSMWPCDMMDVLHRHNLLCVLVHEALSKNMFNMCFDVLQNLPGFQESQADLSVSRYNVLFNKLLSSCVENRSIGMSSSVVDFMIEKKIAVDYVNLRGMILTLAHSGLWTKARRYYKCALALGFYPLFEGKSNSKILYIPSFMSEIEMLMMIEHFMVSNAGSIHSQGGFIHKDEQTVQIVLKRMEEDNAKCKDSYHAANERLLEASRLSTPRLFIKHMTVNNTNEQVYTLDNNGYLKWLNENMKWACNVWLFH